MNLRNVTNEITSILDKLNDGRISGKQAKELAWDALYVVRFPTTIKYLNSPTKRDKRPRRRMLWSKIITSS